MLQQDLICQLSINKLLKGNHLPDIFFFLKIYLFNLLIQTLQLHVQISKLIIFIAKTAIEQCPFALLLNSQQRQSVIAIVVRFNRSRLLDLIYLFDFCYIGLSYILYGIRRTVQICTQRTFLNIGFYEFYDTILQGMCSFKKKFRIYRSLTCVIEILNYRYPNCSIALIKGTHVSLTKGTQRNVLPQITLDYYLDA